MLDRIDKAILKLLLNYPDTFLSTNEIAKKCRIASLTAKRHLEKLERDGYLDTQVKGRTREYEIK